MNGTCDLTLSGHSRGINTIKILSDTRIVSATYDKTLKIWNLVNGTCDLTLNNANWISTIKILPDGRIISGLKNGMMVIWN